MQLRKLGDEHGEQRHRVDDKVDPVVLGVEAGEEVATEDRVKEKKDIRYQEDRNMRGTAEININTALHCVLF